MASRKLQQSVLSAAAQALVNPVAHSAQVAAGNEVFKTANQKLAENPNFKPEQAKKPNKAPKIASIANTAEVVQIGPKIVETKKAQIAGAKAQGLALAETVWKHAREESFGWKPYMLSLVEMGSNSPAQRAFRGALSAEKDAANKTDRQTSRSLFVRISEMMTFSKACEAGFTRAAAAKIWEETHGVETDWDGMNHAALVTCARVYLKTAATTTSDGQDKNTPARGRGRAAKPAIEKIKTFILKTIDPKQLGEVEKMVHALAARIHTPKQAARELEAEQKTVKEERRNPERAKLSLAA